MIGDGRTGFDQGADDMIETGQAAAAPSARADPSNEPPHPPGEYAIVEIMGHQTLVGRIAEVTRFGAAMLQIEPIFAGDLLPPVLQSGAAIYRLTPCAAAVAFARAPAATQTYALPAAIRATLPPALLAPPERPSQSFEVDEDGFLGADDDAGDGDDADEQ